MEKQPSTKKQPSIFWVVWQAAVDIFFIAADVFDEVFQRTERFFDRHVIITMIISIIMVIIMSFFFLIVLIAFG